MSEDGRPVGKIVGVGTQEDPFNAWGYVAIKAVLEGMQFVSGRAFRAQVVKALRDDGFANANSLTDDHLIWVFSNVIRLRADLKPNRYSYGSGTSFLKVKLVSKGMRRYKAFQTALETVAGVIEWDHIPGRDADYLVRVVGKLGDPQMHVISEAIAMMDNVAEVFAPAELTIANSGVVDNFQPEDFLKFDLSDHPRPPKLHPWRDEAFLEDDQRTLPHLSR
jgi:hypothetical protein